MGQYQYHDTDIGPIINDQSLEALNKHIETCRDKGMVIYKSSEEHQAGFISPTIIEINDISDLTDEQFGPILHVLKFKSNKVDFIGFKF